jgi:hypothetical protein
MMRIGQFHAQTDTYTYLGTGRIYRVPKGQPGAGSLLNAYHAEINTDAGLALSKDDSLHWTDLSKIIRPNQAYETDLASLP